MNENSTIGEIAQAQKAGNSTTKPKRMRLACVKVYFKPEEFLRVINGAVGGRFRGVGLFPYLQVAHSWGDEKRANTDGIAKFLKFCFAEYEKSAGRRADVLAEIAREESENAERIRKKRELAGL